MATPAYTVTFDKNGGNTEAIPTTKTTIHGGNVGTLPEAPTKTCGYTFASWNTQADGSGTEFTEITVVTADITVYAQWTGSVHNLVKGTYYTTIQAALDDAGTGNTIEVADGTYEENIIFPINKAIILSSVNGKGVTTIKGTGDDSVVTISGCPDGTILDGFTITGSNTAESGGGILIEGGCSPTIQNNTISENNASYGGGIYIKSGSPIIGGADEDNDTANFNIVCQNTTDGNCTTTNQIFPNTYSHNYICISCAGCGGL